MIKDKGDRRPMCRDCGKAHFPKEPHIWGESRAKAVVDAKPKSVAKAETVSRPATGRSVAATSEAMGVTAGETAPVQGAEAEIGALPSASTAMQGVTAVVAEGSLPNVACPPVVGSNPTSPAKGFDRKAYMREYQREYMRKWRANKLKKGDAQP